MSRTAAGGAAGTAVALGALLLVDGIGHALAVQSVAGLAIAAAGAATAAAIP